MKIDKIAGGARPSDKKDFAFAENEVQGARVGKNGAKRYIASARRFKLRGEENERIDVLAGSGAIKWKRGEIPFAAGDAFLTEAPGEYELNGACEFTVEKT